MEAPRPPSIDRLARQLAAGGGAAIPLPVRIAAARRAIAEARSHGASADHAALAAADLARLAGRRPTRVVNATGVLLHTNLGRASLHSVAAEAARVAAMHHANVELDLSTGSRGGRDAYAAELLAALTGAEAATVVNNNAGALVLTLATLGGTGHVVVSRGELIEIGGSFRLPDLMAASAASVVEVGTTNRTRLEDYEEVIADATVVLKVHPSNYRIEGYAASVGYRELAALCRRRAATFVVDVGSGLLDARTPWLPGSPPAWLAAEPGVRQTLGDGADLVLFSGDKLLGGPQAGLVVGRGDLVARLDAHPLKRALRIDGPTMAALAATLDLYADGRAAEIPFWHVATLRGDELEERLQPLLGAVEDDGRVVAGESVAGAGSVPGWGIPTPVLSVAGRADRRWRTLLDSDPPILARREAGRLVVDLRAVDPGDDEHVASRLAVTR